MFLCLPLFGEDYHFDEQIFQMDWFNHQLVQVYKPYKWPKINGVTGFFHPAYMGVANRNPIYNCWIWGPPCWYLVVASSGIFCPMWPFRWSQGVHEMGPVFFFWGGGGKAGDPTIQGVVHPRKLTWQWEITIFSRRFIFNWLAFQCHVSFPRCNVDGFPFRMVWVSIAMTFVNRMSLALTLEMRVAILRTHTPLLHRFKQTPPLEGPMILRVIIKIIEHIQEFEFVIGQHKCAGCALKNLVLNGFVWMVLCLDAAPKITHRAQTSAVCRCVSFPRVF